MVPKLDVSRLVPSKQIISSMWNNIFKRYQRLALQSSKLQSILLLGISLYWGWQFFVTGKGKLTHIERTASFFSKPWNSISIIKCLDYRRHRMLWRILAADWVRLQISLHPTCLYHACGIQHCTSRRSQECLRRS